MNDFTGAGGALSDRLVEELQRRIFVGQIPVGTWLRHGTLAEEFGISRTPVREALRVLHAQGLVTIVQNRGARVNGHSGRDIRELGEVRAELEGLAAELAATRLDDEQHERMFAAVRDFEEAAQEYRQDKSKMFLPEANRRWREANEAFHSAVIEASGNKQLLAAIADTSRRLPRNMSYTAYAGNSRVLLQNSKEHESIALAIQGRDGKLARRLMVKHIIASSEAMARYAEDVARGLSKP